MANGLPVTVEVRLSISSTTGLRVAPIPTQRVPPLGRRQVQVDAQVVRSGQFVVEAMVRTAAGRQLGPPSRLQVRSTAYGTITVWLTGCASVLLVVLAARGWCAGSGASRAVATGSGPSAGPASEARTATGDTPQPGPTRRPPRGDAADPEPPTRPVAAPAPAPPTRPVPTRGPRATDPPGTGPPAVNRRARPVQPAPRLGTGEPGGRGRAPSGPSLGRASSLMAVASLVSRVTGFLRQLALVTVLGLGVVNDAYNVANTLPNIVYELLLGGVLTSVMVPLLVRAQTEDADGGEATPAGCSRSPAPRSALATLVAMAAAPLLTRLYLGDGAGPAHPRSLRRSPGCCCRRSSSTASARCSARSSTPAVSSGRFGGPRCSTTSW